MQQRLERKHNFLEVSNEITYEKSIVNKPRAEKPNPLSSLFNRCCLFSFGDLYHPQ